MHKRIIRLRIWNLDLENILKITKPPKSRTEIAVSRLPVLKKLKPESKRF